MQADIIDDKLYNTQLSMALLISGTQEAQTLRCSAVSIATKKKHNAYVVIFVVPNSNSSSERVYILEEPCREITIKWKDIATVQRSMFNSKIQWHYGYGRWVWMIEKGPRIITHHFLLNLLRILRLFRI
jgi:hypothetical protein